VEEFSQLTRGLDYVDTLIQREDDLFKRFKNVPFFLSVHQTEQDHFDYFIVIRTMGKVGLPDFEKVLKGLDKPVNMSSERNYVRTKITSYTFGDDQEDIYISLR